VRILANVENLFDKWYFINADGDINIAPGSRRAGRLGVRARCWVAPSSVDERRSFPSDARGRSRLPVSDPGEGSLQA
jgi:hypothetical protein